MDWTDTCSSGQTHVAQNGHMWLRKHTCGLGHTHVAQDRHMWLTRHMQLRTETCGSRQTPTAGSCESGSGHIKGRGFLDRKAPVSFSERSPIHAVTYNSTAKEMPKTMACLICPDCNTHVVVYIRGGQLWQQFQHSV